MNVVLGVEATLLKRAAVQSVGESQTKELRADRFFLFDLFENRH